MSDRPVPLRPNLLAWSIAGVGIGLNVLFSVLGAVNGPAVTPPIVGTFVGTLFLVVGALVATAQPRNPIGWLYLVCLLLISFGGSNNDATQYAYYALVTRPGALPGPEWVLWAGQVSLEAAFSGLILFSLLLFPSGRLPSRRWRPVAATAVVLVVVETVATALAPGPLPDRGPPELQVPNPAGIDALGPLVDAISAPWLLLTIGVMLLALASQVLRFRQARGTERQQLKWFALGGAWILTVGLLGVAAMLLGLNLDPIVTQNAWPLSVAGIPIATGVAILRYRLYDIDILINRALVYGATTAGIALAFVGGIVVLQALLRPVTGGSELAVAASTLASVALFQPLRARVQSGVDRRFYRSRYDAARTLDAFSVRLRDEVELGAVRAELLEAVRSTVQPAHASVWLRR